jgi:phage/plasmid primase-like uncharacterized protein
MTINFPFSPKARKCKDGWVDICPAHNDQQPSLSIGIGEDGQLLLHCFAGCSFTDILVAAGLRGGLHVAQVSADVVQRRCETRQQNDEKTLARCNEIWRQGKPIEGTLSHAYLASRGITVFSDCLRHHEGLIYSRTGERLPVLLTAAQRGGKLTGLHRIFLNPDGTKRDKLMLGSFKGAAAHLVGKYGPLYVAEGIETALSLPMLNPQKIGRYWAAFSAGGMKSLVLPQRPDQLIIAADGDTAGLEAANDLGERAARAGWQVILMAAPDGKDWNDVLVEGSNDKV